MDPRRILLVSTALWGHLKPSIALSLNLLSDDEDTEVTLLFPRAVLPAVQAEIEAFDVPHPDVKKRLHVDPVGDGTENPIMLMIKAEPLYTPSITTYLDGKQAARPDVIFTDAIVTFTASLVRKYSANIPVVVLAPFPLCSVFAWFHPMGRTLGFGERTDRAIAEGGPEVQNQDRLDLLVKEFTRTEGKVYELPGCAPMYDYEENAQDEACPKKPPFVRILELMIAQVYESNVTGFISNSTPVAEPGAAALLQKGLKRSIYQTGPQYPASWWDTDRKDLGAWVESRDAPVMQFLDRCLHKFGSRSLIYISFGTMFFPAGRVDLVLCLIEALITAEPFVPFVFATAGPAGEHAPALKKALAESPHPDGGLITGFAPQMRVLAHPATGYFLTHGGASSTLEAMMTEVVPIFWPLQIDQPFIAAQWSYKLDVGFELLQIRNGGSAVGKPVARNGVVVTGKREDVMREMRDTIVAMRGLEGERKRKNLVELRTKAHDDWKIGESRQAMNSLKTIGRKLPL